MFISLYFFQDASDVQILVARSVKHSINFMDVKDLNRLILSKIGTNLVIKAELQNFVIVHFPIMAHPHSVENQIILLE